MGFDWPEFLAKKLGPAIVRLHMICPHTSSQTRLPNVPSSCLPLLHQFTMSDSIDDDFPFDWRSGDLMTWFKQQRGAKVNPSIKLQDLRDRGAGRGVGSFSSSNLVPELVY